MADDDTHIDRINPGLNPAHIPGIDLGPKPDGRRPYRTTTFSRSADVILPPGTIVMLLLDEVRPHHQPAEIDVEEAQAAWVRARGGRFPTMSMGERLAFAALANLQEAAPAAESAPAAETEEQPAAVVVDLPVDPSAKD